MFKIATTINGKPFTKDSFKDALSNAMKKNLEERLKPFAKEIQAAGSKVAIDLSTSKVKLENMPEELLSKIQKHLSKG